MPVQLRPSLAAFLLMLAATIAPCRATLLFVSDAGTFSLRTFDGGTGAFIGQDNAGNSIGNPTGVALGPDGNIYLADANNGTIDRFNGNTGVFMNQFVTAGTGLISPSGITFGPDGNLYVADFGTGGNSFVDEFNGTTGSFVRQVVAPGVGPNGGLNRPPDLTFGPGGLYVSDPANGVDLFDPATGAFLAAFVPLGCGPGAPACLGNPTGLRWGPDGNLYVADASSSVVDFFNSSGTFLGVFGATNSLAQPLGLTFGPDGSLFVVDNSGVEHFAAGTGASLGAFIPAGANLIVPQYLAFGAPEPSTLALFAFGFVLLAAIRFRSGLS